MLSGQFIKDLWSATMDWVSSGVNCFQLIGQKVVTPIVMLENMLDFIGYGLTASGIICLGIVCYRVMYEDGYGFQIMFKACPRGWGRGKNQVLSIAPVALD